MLVQELTWHLKEAVTREAGAEQRKVGDATKHPIFRISGFATQFCAELNLLVMMMMSARRVQVDDDDSLMSQKNCSHAIK